MRFTSQQWGWCLTGSGDLGVPSSAAASPGLSLHRGFWQRLSLLVLGPRVWGGGCWPVSGTQPLRPPRRKGLSPEEG